MVFSSIPVYLDPPNWHQQQNHHHHHQTLASTTENSNLPPLPPPSLPSNLTHVGGPSSGAGAGSIRPGSMADRARMAKIPQPETALKCPRCESTNTKFCYFNNYSLTQPRHFCKTCRRYWTRNGALRNVPVGGGCRRNKKSKSSSHSKSPATASGDISNKQSGSSANPSGGLISPSVSNPSNSAEMTGHFSTQAAQSHSSFMASIQNLARFGATGSGSGALGLNFSEIQGQTQHEHGNLGFQIGSASESGDHQWRLQQFPLMGGHEFEAQAGNLYPNFHQGIEGQSGNMASISMIPSRASQLNSVKLEGRHGLNLSSRPSLGISENNNQFWVGNGTSSSWTDLSGLNSSSTTHLL